MILFYVIFFDVDVLCFITVLAGVSTLTSLLPTNSVAMHVLSLEQGTKSEAQFVDVNAPLFEKDEVRQRFVCPGPLMR